MNNKKGYIPSQDGNKKTWASNLKAKIAANGASVGLLPADITAIQNACADIDTQINTLGQAKATLKQTVATKKSKVKAAETLLRQFAKRIKAHAAYTTTIGNDLGIIGEDITIDEDNSKPILKLTKVPTGYRIEFSLLSHFDGVNIYKKLSSETEYSFLARDTSSPYIDTKKVDNGTTYVAYYLIADDEVGQQSDAVLISL